MKLGIRTRLFLVWLVPIAAALVLADVVLTRTLDAVLVDRIREDLFARLSLCERDEDLGHAGPSGSSGSALKR